MRQERVQERPERELRATEQDWRWQVPERVRQERVSKAPEWVQA